MNRRRFLTLTGAAAGACALSRASGASVDDPIPAARARAEAAGKPLLLIPVPEESKLQGQVTPPWQWLFSSSSDEHLAILALVEVIFAPTPRGQVFDFKTNLALLAHPGQPGWHVIECDARAMNPEQLAARLRSVLVPDQAAIDALADLVGQSAPPHYCHGALHWKSESHWPRVKFSTIDRVAAWAWRQYAATESEELQAVILRGLANAAAVRLYEQDPAGAHWEEPPQGDPCPGCGMAVMPPSSRLFLDAYTR